MIQHIGMNVPEGHECVTGLNPHGFCGAASYCSQNRRCCVGCPEPCNSKCGYISDAEQPQTLEPSGSPIRMIPIARLAPHPDNPRKDLGDLSELADSIRANGVLQNLTVVPAPQTDTLRKAPMNRLDGPVYRVIIGHRRMAAARLAGLTELPCAVADLTPEQQVAVMLTENIQRNALTPYEEAMGFQQLQIDFGKSVAEISRMSGTGESTVRSRLKLAEMDGRKVQQGFERGATLFDFSEVEKLEDPAAREKCLDAIGTANFQNELKRAKNEQSFQKQYIAALDAVREFAAEIQKPEEKFGEDGSLIRRMTEEPHLGLDFVRKWARWQRSDFEKPEDAGEVKYFFYRDEYNELTLYREHIVDDETDAQRRREREARAAWDARASELMNISDRHFELRKEFVMNFGKAKTFLGNIVFDSSEIIVRYFSNLPHYITSRNTADLFRDYFDLEADDNDENAGSTIMSEFLAIRSNAPEKTFMTVLFWLAEGSGLTYVNREWNSEKRRYEAHYTANPVLDTVYYMLESLGYQMSDEEKQVRNGTHPLFHTEETES